MFLFFFFQAEDGIRDYKVTGVQTCALPISAAGACARLPLRTRLHCRSEPPAYRLNLSTLDGPRNPGSTMSGEEITTLVERLDRIEAGLAPPLGRQGGKGWDTPPGGGRGLWGGGDTAPGGGRPGPVHRPKKPG